MLVVFDLDGTLVDSSGALLEAHDVAWAQFGLERPSDEAILELIGLPLQQVLKTLAPDHDPQPIAEAYSRAYAAAAGRHERLFDGMDALLAKDFRAAVATGKSQRGAERTVARHGLEERFEIVLGADPSRQPKPHPHLLEIIRDETGESDLVMIGDTTYDLEMAHRAGMRAIGVSWGHHDTPRLSKWAPVVDTVEELGRMLGV